MIGEKDMPSGATSEERVQEWINEILGGQTNTPQKLNFRFTLFRSEKRNSRRRGDWKPQRKP